MVSARQLPKIMDHESKVPQPESLSYISDWNCLCAILH